MAIGRAGGTLLDIVYSDLFCSIMVASCAYFLGKRHTHGRRIPGVRGHPTRRAPVIVGNGYIRQSAGRPPAHGLI
jgi:hypothetical protein